jgi:hypothetical protein
MSITRLQDTRLSGTMGSVLITDPAPIIGAGWVPSDSANARAWFDAQDGANIATSGSNVTSWTNRIGGEVLSASGGTITQVTNSHLVFNQTTGLTNPSTRMGFSTGVPDVILAIVVQPDTIILNQPESYTYFTQGTSALQMQTWGASRNTTQNYITYLSGTNVLYNNYDPTDYNIYLFHKAGAGTFGSMVMRENGVDISGTASNGGNTPTNLGDGFAIGSFVNNTNRMSGKIREVVGFESLFSTDGEIIEGYLAHKWGLESKLPANHPYKASAP